MILKNLWHEVRALSAFQYQEYIICSLYFFWFILVNFRDWGSGNGTQATMFSGRPGILSTLLCCMIINTLLHSQYDILLLEKVFNDHIHWNGLFICEVHYWVCVSVRVKQQHTEDPVPGCQKYCRASPSSLHQTFMSSWRGRSQWRGPQLGNGIRFSEDNFLVFISIA